MVARFRGLHSDLQSDSQRLCVLKWVRERQIEEHEIKNLALVGWVSPTLLEWRDGIQFGGDERKENVERTPKASGAETILSK